MAETRHTSGSSSRPMGVRRNLFHQHLSRRPTTSSTSTSAETLRLDLEADSETSDIVIRDKNGDFEIGDPPIPELDEQEEPGTQDAREDKSELLGIQGLITDAYDFIEEQQRLVDAVKHHQRDRNRAPSEPAGRYGNVTLYGIYAQKLPELLEAVRASLRAKVAALADDNWMYEAEDDAAPR